MAVKAEPMPASHADPQMSTAVIDLNAARGRPVVDGRGVAGTASPGLDGLLVSNRRGLLPGRRKAEHLASQHTIEALQCKIAEQEAEIARGSRPAEWCKSSRVCLRGGGCRLNYDAIWAGSATPWLTGSSVGGWVKSAIEASDR